MGGLSWMHWLVVAVLVLLLFGGRGKLSSIMGDAAKGIKAFQKGLKDDGASSAETTDAGYDPDKPAGRITSREHEDAKR